MRSVILVFFLLPMLANSQLDSVYVEELPLDKTIQFHTTGKDLKINLHKSNEDLVAFRNHNWSVGLYFRWNRAELFLALPVTIFDNQTVGSPRTFGTGFGLNFYPRKYHLNYNFKYIQGFDSFSQVRMDGLQTLTKNNYFIFNRLNTHYVQDQRFSLRAAIRFNDRQKKSAGSLLLGAPLTYHLGAARDVFDNEFDHFSRFAIGAMAGYGYTFVRGNWASSVILKGGLELRRSSFRSMSQWSLTPTVNYIISTVYNWSGNFVGIVYNDYPEFASDKNLTFSVVNWKARIYAGKRF